MTDEEMKDLKPGDIIQSASGLACVVASNDGIHITAVREFDVSNPSEWTLIQKNNKHISVSLQ